MLPALSPLAVANHLHAVQAVEQDCHLLGREVAAGRRYLDLTQAQYLRHHLQVAAIETAHAQALLRLFTAANDATAIGGAGRG